MSEFAALSIVLVISALTGSTSDFWVFAGGLVAGAVIVVAIRRDLPTQPWDGRNRRRVK